MAFTAVNPEGMHRVVTADLPPREAIVLYQIHLEGGRLVFEENKHFR